jgi:ABC-2 type transport system permease protein
MRKTLTVAAREYNATVRTKAFIVSLVLMPVMMGGSILVQFALKDQVDTKERRFAVIDRTEGGTLYDALEARAKLRNDKEIFDPETGKQVKPAFTLERVQPSANTPDAVLQQRYELSERIRKKDLFGFLEIGHDVFDAQAVVAAFAVNREKLPKESKGDDLASIPTFSFLPDRLVLRYQSNSPMYGSFHNWATQKLTEAILLRRTKDSDIDLQKLTAAVTPVPMLNKGLTRLSPRTGQIEDGRDVNFLASFFAPFALIMMMFMIIMAGASPLMQGVLEEKMNRISEVLLGSVTPFQLMMGKLLGMVGVAITLATVYLTGAYWAASHYGFLDYVSAEVLVWFLVYQTLAVLMYGSIFIAVGAASTDAKESQSLLMPVMLVICLPLFVLTNVIREPDGALATGMSYFPPSTPMLMIARLSIPPGIPWWEPYLGVLVVLAMTLLCVWAASRIFRIGILMQGKGARFGELVKWVFHG